MESNNQKREENFFNSSKGTPVIPVSQDTVELLEIMHDLDRIEERRVMWAEKHGQMIEDADANEEAYARYLRIYLDTFAELMKDEAMVAGHECLRNATGRLDPYKMK